MNLTIVCSLTHQTGILLLFSITMSICSENVVKSEWIALIALILSTSSFFLSFFTLFENKKDGKDQETIQSSTTPDPGYHMGK